MDRIFTVGHSTLPYARFLSLLAGAGVTAVADVRSAPFSRRFPHFDREALRAGLGRDGVGYQYIGGELGGRPSDPSLYRRGVADYELMAGAGRFGPALARVVEGAAGRVTALMCSEQDPLDCHRCLLLGRALHARGVPVSHIVPGGEPLGHAEVEERLLAMTGRGGGDLFASREERLALAYRDRNRRVAFSGGQPDAGPPD